MTTMVYPLDDWRKWQYVNSGVADVLMDLRYPGNYVTRIPDIKLEHDLALELVECAPTLAAKRCLVRLMRQHPDEAVVVSV